MFAVVRSSVGLFAVPSLGPRRSVLGTGLSAGAVGGTILSVVFRYVFIVAGS